MIVASPRQVDAFSSVFLSSEVRRNNIWRAFGIKLRQACLLAILGVVTVCAKQAVCADTGDTPLQKLTPSNQIALNPCFAMRSGGFRLVTGTSVQGISLTCSGEVSWAIPEGASSFHVILWRADVANALATAQLLSDKLDFLRVRISLDNVPVADTVLGAADPAEKWEIPTNHARILTIKMEQEYGAEAVYLGDPAFSHQAVSAVSVRHVLSPGSGFANLGSGPRQRAFFDFHPGESVPLQVEFAGKAANAEVRLNIAPLAGTGARTLSVPVALQPDADGSVGSGQWQVPEFFGPANIVLTVNVQGRQVFTSTTEVAFAKTNNLANVTQSNFGIHLSTSGSLFLQDDFADLWGAKWARFFLAWDVIESKEGQYDWHWIDNVVATYSAQHLQLLGVMGELQPKWITDPRTQMAPAYARFVKAALEHFQGKIHVWDTYNEINSKYYAHRGFDPATQPRGDIDLLREELQEIHQFDPGLITVCCSPGGTDFLPYSKRLFDAGIIGMVNDVSMHPYQAGPPEDSDDGLSYPEMVDRLGKLAASYGTQKPVWTSEANWVMGPAGTAGVSAPGVTEHEQSQYLVRANLLSLGLHVPYFSHSPFFFPYHRNVLVDSLSSYAEMTALLSNAQNARLLSLPPHIYGVTASTSAGTVVALWTDAFKPVTVHMTGLGHMTIQDMYGNPLPASESPVLSDSPIYVIGTGSPVVTAAALQVPAARSLPEPSAWSHSPSAHVENAASGIHLTSEPSQYAGQVTSPILNVSPNSCYVFTPSITLHKGGIDVEVVDPDNKKLLRAEFVFTVTGNDQYQPHIRVKTADDSHLQLVFTDANPHQAEVTDFILTNVAMSPCP